MDELLRILGFWALFAIVAGVGSLIIWQVFAWYEWADDVKFNTSESHSKLLEIKHILERRDSTK